MAQTEEFSVYPVGTKATFNGSSDASWVPMFPVGQLILVTRYAENGNMVATGINADGAFLDTEGKPFVEGGDLPLMADEVWPNELTVVSLGGEVAADEAPAETPADVVAEAPGEAAAETPATDFAAMKSAELEEWASRVGVSLPDGWGKMKLDAKRAFLADWEAVAASGAPLAEVAATTAALPVVGTPAAALLGDSERLRELLADTDAVEAAKELIRIENNTVYKLGLVLSHINETGIYKRYGFEGKKGFEDFCQKYLDIAYRKARYHIDIYLTFSKLGIDERRLDAIGWSKAKELARISLDSLEADIDDLLEFAKDHTRDELIDHIRTNYEVNTRATSVAVTAFSFKVVEENATVIKTALDHAKALTGDDDANRALLHICGDWMNAADGTDLDLDAFVRLGADRFGRDAIISALSALAEETDTAPETESEAV